MIPINLHRVSFGIRVLLPIFIVLNTGCNPGEESQAPASQIDAKSKSSANPDAKLSKTERELQAIDQLAETGNVDKAAAALVKMRMKGTKFNTDEAAAYRDSLSLVYDEALELNENGDARAKAALKILQSNAAF